MKNSITAAKLYFQDLHFSIKINSNMIQYNQCNILYESEVKQNESKHIHSSRDKPLIESKIRTINNNENLIRDMIEISLPCHL